jgi:hypothetical protein
VIGRVALAFGLTSAALTGPVIPWRADRPPRIPEPPLAKPCDAAVLRAKPFFQGAHGSLVGGVTLSNTGRTKCSLRGRVTARFAGGSAEGTAWTVVAGPAPRRDPSAVYDRDSSLRALAPGRGADIHMRWVNWCPPGTTVTSTGPPPDGLIVDLPRGRGSLRVPLTSAPRCDFPAQPSTLVVGPPARRGRYLPPSSRLPFRASINAPTVGIGGKRLPTLRARRGHVLGYTVTLVNVSRRPFRFRRCPTYTEHLAPRGPSATLILNCRPAGTLAPGGRARFAMRLQIPAATPLGPHGLSWELAPATHLPPFATVRVVVSD